MKLGEIKINGVIIGKVISARPFEPELKIDGRPIQVCMIEPSELFHIGGNFGYEIDCKMTMNEDDHG